MWVKGGFEHVVAICGASPRLAADRGGGGRGDGVDGGGEAFGVGGCVFGGRSVSDGSATLAAGYRGAELAEAGAGAARGRGGGAGAAARAAGRWAVEGEAAAALKG